MRASFLTAAFLQKSAKIQHMRIAPCGKKMIVIIL